MEFEKKEKIKCPKCLGFNTIKIVYGYPTQQKKEAKERGEIELGGCVIMGFQPNRKCLDCHTAFITGKNIII